MSEIFCVQDRTGTAAQLVLGVETTAPIDIGDTGVYSGRNWNGVATAYDFTVGQVNDALNFCITTMTPLGASGNVLQSNWPRAGTITWLTGDNALMSPNTTVVVNMHPANAYTDPDYFISYHLSRGNTVVESPIDPILHAIVQGSDYINQRYRYKGIKLLQYLHTSNIDPRVVDPWFAFLNFGGAGFGSVGFGPSFGDITSQYTEWPRQGVIDFNGDNVYGVPKVIKDACCEAAFREQNGTPLQPDYDSEVVTPGGIVLSAMDEIGPIKTSRTYDTKLGVGFFPEIPQIRRMLSKAGILLAGGGRTIIR